MILVKGGAVSRDNYILSFQQKLLLSLWQKHSDRNIDVRCCPKAGQIGPKWDKSGAFSDQISVHFGSPDLYHLGSIWTPLSQICHPYFGIKQKHWDSTNVFVERNNRLVCLNIKKSKLSSIFDSFSVQFWLLFDRYGRYRVSRETTQSMWEKPN